MAPGQSSDEPNAVTLLSKGALHSARRLLQRKARAETGLFLAEGVQAQTHQALKNLQAVLGEAGLTLDSVVKTTVFVQDLGNFGAVNEVYGSYFHGGFPARSCVQIAALPKNALVEIECIAVR